MKVSQISLIIGLSMLLNLSTSIASINNKIAIIAAGSAVTAVGSTLWQTLRSYRGNIEMEFNGEPLNIDIHNANKFSEALSEKVFNKNLIERIKLKIINDIKRYTDNDKSENIKFIINKKDDTVSIETKVNGVLVNDRPIFLDNIQEKYFINLKDIPEGTLENLFYNEKNKLFYTSDKTGGIEDTTAADLREPTLAEVDGALMAE